MNTARLFTRALAVTALGATSLMALPSAPASALGERQVTVKVTNVKVLDAIDANSCGEFRGLWFQVNSRARKNIVPTASELNWNWNGAFGAPVTTYDLCESNYYGYTVPQASLGAFVANQMEYMGTGLYRFDPLTATNLNQEVFNTFPGATLTLSTGGEELDPKKQRAYDVSTQGGQTHVTVPAAGKSKIVKFTPPFKAGLATKYPVQYTVEISTKG